MFLFTAAKFGNVMPASLITADDWYCRTVPVDAYDIDNFFSYYYELEKIGIISSMQFWAWILTRVEKYLITLIFIICNQKLWKKLLLIFVYFLCFSFICVVVVCVHFPILTFAFIFNNNSNKSRYIDNSSFLKKKKNP